MEAATEVDRRPLSYSRISEVLEDAELLAKGEHRTTGEWSFGQILWHLGATYQASFDGFTFKAPWLARTFIAPFVKKGFLSNKMKPGFVLPDSAKSLMPDPDVTTEQGLERLREAVKRFESASPSEFHPFFGRMTADQWLQIHLRHAELHLSFVWPA